MLVNSEEDGSVEIDELWPIAECIFCKIKLTSKNELRNSKLIPCLHAMCSKCYHNFHDGGELSCGVCNYAFKKEELCNNMVLMEIVSEENINTSKNYSCTIHQTVVTHWCTNCKEFICAECINQHAQLKSTRTHTFISKEQYHSTLSDDLPKRIFPCEVHPKNDLSIICNTCSLRTCRDCQLQFHKDHKYDFIVDKIDGAKQELFHTYKNIEYKSIILSAALKKLSERESKIEQLKKKMISDIKREFEIIEEMLKKRANELMIKAVEKANLKLQECDKKKKILQQNLSDLQYCTRFVKCVLHSSSDPVVFYMKELMLNRMKSFQLNVQVPCAVNVINLSFSPENIEKTKVGIESCGAILEKQDPSTPKDIKYWNSVCSAIWAEFSKRTPRNKIANSTASIAPIAPSVDKLSKQSGQVPETVQVPARTDVTPNAELPLKKACLPAVTPVIDLTEPSLPQFEALSNPSPLHININNDNAKKSPVAQQPSSKNSEATSWHIPESFQLLARSEISSNAELPIKKVCLPPVAPVIDLTEPSLPNFETLDIIMKDLDAFEEKEKQRTNSQQPSPAGLQNEGWCSVCLRCEDLISCNNCPKVFHRQCHIPYIDIPLPTHWTCLLCQEIMPLPPDNYLYFRPDDLKVAHRLLLEIFCQVEASGPFRYSNSSHSKCLYDIKACLLNRRYKGILNFVVDVKSMFADCYRHKQGDPQIFAHGRSLEEMFNRLLKKFIPHQHLSL